MFNLYTTIKNNPGIFRQFSCRDSLISVYNCPLEKKLEDAWSHYNYIVYVVEGRKIWHTPHGSYDLRQGNCVFVKKGACIIEQFFDVAFCLVSFFLPDEFICEVLKSRSAPITAKNNKPQPVIAIDASSTIHSFFQSMMTYFNTSQEPDPALLELKFRELILTIADNPRNADLLAYFNSLMQQPQSVNLQRIMEDNFCYNLKLEEFAKLCSRSLSAFKRDFEKIYHTTPGRWLTEKRLDHALHLLTHLDKTVAEAAFESGFENPSHFSRSFRQRFGTSPASMKQQISI